MYVCECVCMWVCLCVYNAMSMDVDGAESSSGYSYYDGTIELVALKVDMVTECLSVPVKNRRIKRNG